MTDYQKRQFKRKTLDTIDSILDDSPTQTAISYVQGSSSSYCGISYSVLSPEPPGRTPEFPHLGNLYSEGYEPYERINNNSSTVQNYLNTFTE